MVRLPASSSRKRESGLTLIEVLIALAIIAIGLTAIIKASSQNIRSTAYLRHKTQALWVAQNVMAQAQSGAIILPQDEDMSDDVMTVLGEDWHWRGHTENTANNHISKLVVDVSDTADRDQQPVISLESYQYAE